jgi:hypothetical protein
MIQQGAIRSFDRVVIEPACGWTIDPGPPFSDFRKYRIIAVTLLRLSQKCHIL